MLNYLCFFVLFNAVKTDTKLTLHHMRKMFIISLTKIKFKIWRVTFLKGFFTIKKDWDGLPFFSQETIYHVHTEMRQSLVLNLNYYCMTEQPVINAFSMKESI